MYLSFPMNGSKNPKIVLKKVFAVLFVVAAMVNLTLLALGRIEPYVFILTLTFIALVTFSYYKND